MVWNTQMKFWEHYKESQLFEHLEPYLGTWPTSGTMLDGQVYELVMPEHHTSDLESLLLRTPVASEAEGGAVAPEVAKANGQTLRLSGQMIDLMAPGQLPKLPTPTTQDGKNNGGPSQFNRNTKPLNTEVLLIGTPRANAAESSSKQVELGAPKSRIEDQVLATNWGKFEPAIRRWEAILDRPAPEPTKPDGKDNNHRLSSKFTEWMMGLPDGWITDIGLKRNDELKACGNGVVPQQAELALSLLGINDILRGNNE
jgi:hypothetical protein